MFHEETTGGKLNLGNAHQFSQSQVWKNFQEKNRDFDAEQNFFKGFMQTVAVPVGKRYKLFLCNQYVPV